MKGKFLNNLIGVAICLTILFPALALGGPKGKAGPPSHAPAHGPWELPMHRNGF
jgi:hypothetical protein